MTAKEVQDIVIDKYQQEYGAENMEKLLKKLRNKPFWIWGSVDHRRAMKSLGLPNSPHPPKQCCFNCILAGLVRTEKRDLSTSSNTRSIKHCSKILILIKEVGHRKNLKN